VKTVEPLVAQPGQTYWKAPARQMITPQPFHHRAKPVTAVCPVARVYRSISMLITNWTIRVAKASQSRPSPPIAVR
jgi:hypothetical protein